MCRVRGGQGQRGRGGHYSGGRGSSSSQSFSGGRAFCPGCFYLSKQLSANINYSHNASQCPRKAATVQLLEAEDLAISEADIDNTAGESQPRSANNRSKNDPQEKPIQINVDCPAPNNDNIEVADAEHFINIDDNKSSSMINHISQCVHSILKAKSPTLWLSVNGVCTHSVIDEGSELVVIDFEFSKKAKIPIEKSNQKAKSADNKSMSIVGQTKYPLQVSVKGPRVPLTLNLGQCVVISNLGCPILIGQPAKIANEIVMYPHKFKIEMKDIHGVKHLISYPLPPPPETLPSETLKTVAPTVLYPEESISFTLSNQFSNCKDVVFSPRPSYSSLTPSYLPVQGNLTIHLTNTSSIPINIPKHAHIGDIRAAIDYDTALISRLYTIDESTFDAFKPSIEFERK